MYQFLTTSSLRLVNHLFLTTSLLLLYVLSGHVTWEIDRGCPQCQGARKERHVEHVTGGL